MSADEQQENLSIGATPIERTIALELLAQHKPILVARYGVTRLALFGSTSRGAARSGSDVDILVAFDGPNIGALLWRAVLPGRPARLCGRSRHRQSLAPRAAPIYRTGGAAV